MQNNCWYSRATIVGVAGRLQPPHLNTTPIHLGNSPIGTIGSFLTQSSYPIRESKFPDFSLTGSQNTQFFPDQNFTYLQEEVKTMEPIRKVMHIILVISQSKAYSSHLLTTFRATTFRTTMPVVNESDMLTKYFVFPDLDKNYKKFTHYSRFSLTFRKDGLFSRFSRFSMNPVTVLQISLLF